MPRHKPKVNAHTLYSILDQQDANEITDIISHTRSSPPISARTFLLQLLQNGQNSTVFNLTRQFFAKVVEKINYQTKDVEGHGIMTIGIGLNLANTNTEALLYAANPSRKWNFDELRVKAGLPQPPLSDQEADNLLYYALIGAKKDDKIFKGYAQQLIQAMEDLANMQLFLNQIITLQSMVYNAFTLVGNGTRSALRQMEQWGDLPVLIDIMEHSNRGCDVGLQNRRLKEVALFHGKADAQHLDVHLSWRQYQKIREYKDDDILLIGDPVIWGIPSGDDHVSFRGGDKIQIIHDKHECNDIIYGTPQNDKFTTCAGRPIIFGGDGDDYIESIQLDSASNVPSPYYAGGRGYDIYNLTIPATMSTHDHYRQTLIYDSDHSGMVIINNLALQGLIRSDESYLLGCYAELTGSSIFNHVLTLRCGNGGASYYATYVIIPNYLSGQFSIVWADLIHEQGTTGSTASALFETGNVVFLHDGYYSSELSLRIYNTNGTNICTKEIDIPSSKFYDFSPPISQPNGNFIIYSGVNDYSSTVNRDNLVSFEYTGSCKEVSRSVINTCILNTSFFCFNDFSAVQSSDGQYHVLYTLDSRCNCSQSTNAHTAQSIPISGNKEITKKTPVGTSYMLFLKNNFILTLQQKDHGRLCFNYLDINITRNPEHTIFHATLCGNLMPSVIDDSGNAILVTDESAYYLDLTYFNFINKTNDFQFGGSVNSFLSEMQSKQKALSIQPDKIHPPLQTSGASRLQPPILFYWLGSIFQFTKEFIENLFPYPLKVSTERSLSKRNELVLSYRGAKTHQSTLDSGYSRGGATKTYQAHSCLPLDSSSLICYGENFHIKVFTKSNDKAIMQYGGAYSEVAEDTYNSRSCYPLDFDGRPSVACDGKTTTMIYISHTLPVEKVLANIDGTIGLAAIGIKWISNFYHWLTRSKPTIEYMSSEEFTKSMHIFKQKLEKIKAKIKAFSDSSTWEYAKPELVAKEVKILLESYEDSLADFEELQYKGCATFKRVSELEKDLEYLCSTAFHEAEEAIKFLPSNSNHKQIMFSQNSVSSTNPPGFSFLQHFWQSKNEKSSLPTAPALKHCSQLLLKQ